MNQTKEKYLIALDMDGTLLNKDHIISLETLNYLKKLNKDGHKIIISSGRPIRNIISFYNELELTTPIICYNGAYIYPGKEINFPEYCFSFPQAKIKSIIQDIGYDHLDNVILETNKDIYLLKDDETLDVFFTKNNMNIHLGPIEKNLNEDTMTMLIKVKDEKDNHFVQEAVDKHPNIKLRFWSGKWLDISEIYFSFINKGKALQKVCEYFKIEPDHVISFGDASNDIEIIKYAKYGFAMKNAEDDLKKHAKYITEFDNNENGIIMELKKIGL